MVRGISAFYAVEAALDFAVALLLLVFAWQASLAVPWYKPLAGWVAPVLIGSGAASLVVAGRPSLQTERSRFRLSIAQLIALAYPFLMFGGSDGLYSLPPPWWVLADPFVLGLLPMGLLLGGAILGMIITVPGPTTGSRSEVGPVLHP